MPIKPTVRVLTAGAALLSFPAFAFLLLAGDPEQGKLLHEDKCVGCHVGQFGGDGSSVYSRDPRRVNTIEGLTGQVQTCNTVTKAGLDTDQIDHLIAYLNEYYYKFGD